MINSPPAEAPWVSLSDITEIELVILRRMRDVTMGDHRSRSHGPGFDFVGLRDWQAGDKFSSIDWPQSTLTNFSPLVVREFDQPSTATVMTIADVSASTRCGVDGSRVGAAVARAIAILGMSAVFFQDPFGIVTFDENFEHLGTVRPRTGKRHVVHCLDSYQDGRGLQEVKRHGSLSNTLGGYMRRTSLLPVVSDFLFDNPREILREFSDLNAAHDVFLIMIDAAFAFELPAVRAGWVEIVDVETNRTRTVSRAALSRMGERVRDWQDEVRLIAKDLDLDLVDVGIDQTQADLALSGFIAERRLRKTTT
jgi:uncharacterized protein (DUF58 family)